MAKGVIRKNTEDIQTPKGAATRSYETHPSKGKDVGRGTPQVKGKLGS